MNIIIRQLTPELNDDWDDHDIIVECGSDKARVNLEWLLVLGNHFAIFKNNEAGKRAIDGIKKLTEKYL